MSRDFAEFFRRATGSDPFPYQVRLATAEDLPALLAAPTGAGKTAAVVLAWLWRRRYAEPSIRTATPRRLVYCLPMRVLVEQTRDNVQQWLQAADCDLIDWQTPASTVPEEAIGLAIAMGGEEQADWDLYPDHDCIIVGTQDMLLSRALNRGYGMSRYRWPLQFGLLNNDCLWVHDEVQLMGDGLATSTQLAGLRRKLMTFGPLQELWMSATMRRDWLASYDFEPTLPQLDECALGSDDLTTTTLSLRLTATKTLQLVDAQTGSDLGLLSGLLLDHHRQGTVTLAVVNTVERATGLYQAVKKLAGQRARAGGGPGSDDPQLLLLHSRFRPAERKHLMETLSSAPPAAGRIIVSTQVIEAGVDLSAATLATDLAPWPSLVQRFGRCNRFGEHENAPVLVFDRDPESKPTAQAAPYEAADLDHARTMLQHLGDGADLSPSALRAALAAEPGLAAELLAFEPVYVLRRRDLLDLFDSTTDLAGNDVDVSRFVRDLDQTDVSVFWRDLQARPDESEDSKAPASDDGQWSAPARQELCQVPVSQLREFIKVARERKSRVYLSDHLASAQAGRQGRWVTVGPRQVIPGRTYLVASSAGGYDSQLGWSPKSAAAVPPVVLAEAERRRPDADGDDVQVVSSWQTIAQHSDAVVAELARLVGLLANLEIDEALLQDDLLTAARWHDRGKAHQVFQGALADPPGPKATWAKAPRGAFGTYTRRGFRHELAGALAVRQQGLSDLACYLTAAHHGKVRLGLRPMPDEAPPPADHAQRFARGIWEGDVLPAADLGGGVSAPEVTLSLEPLEMGLGPDGRPSWSELALRLRDEGPGPFRLAFLEALLRVADMRASAANGPPDDGPTATEKEPVAQTQGKE